MLPRVTSPSTRPTKMIPARPPHGIALVIVLAILVLITGLVVAFFSTATKELASAKSYASGSSSQQLADATTQLAIGTIRKATSDTTTSAGGTDVAWSSQPGMIRTWDNRGAPRNLYKLFSSANSEADAKVDYDPVIAGDLDPEFDAKPALFTDLNAPVKDSAGTLHYPILDPTGSVAKDGGTDPLIDGFYVTRPPVARTVINPAPMPVRWLYVLQDGTLVAPTGGDRTATFTGSKVPTVANPIVGRVAYWTDDETSKVNINTASEGVYWDMPRLLSLEDTGRWLGSGTTPTTPGLALTQPAKGEYQRYPGHPATTSLSPILGKLMPDAFGVPDPLTTLNSTNTRVFKTYYDLVPRITQGGSNSGLNIANLSAGASGTAGSVVTDSDRLFASVDEFLFQQPLKNDAGRQVSDAVTKGDQTRTALFKTTLEKAKFFLTAHSSAPEVTMFNTPRVSVWPVWSTTATTNPANAKRTTLDDTLAFCANLKVDNKDTPYYFDRQNSRSMTDDYERSPRNQQLYAYLDKLMKTPVPGFGGSFDASTALGTDQPQVLTSIFDYIRCINLFDASPGTTPNTQATPYTQLVRMNQAFTKTHWGGGEILPIKIASNNTQGFGRYATLSGIDLIFGAAKTIPPETTPNPPPVKFAQVMLVPTFFSPMQGLPGMYPRLKYTITVPDPAAGTFTLDGQAIFKTGGGIDGTTYITNAPVQQAEGRGMGGMISPRAILEKYGEFNPSSLKPFVPGSSYAPANPPNNDSLGAADGSGSGAYPFISVNTSGATTSYRGTPNIELGPLNPLFPQSPPAMTFVGGPLTITVRAADSGELIQTFHVVIPKASLPRPTFASEGQMFNGNANLPFTTGRDPNRSIVTPPTVLLQDVVRGVEVAGLGDNDPSATEVSTNTSAGDVRMIAALPDVPATFYHAHKDYAGGTQASGMGDDDGVNRNFRIGSLIGNDYTGKHGALAKGINPRNATNASPTNLTYGRRSPYVPSRTVSGNLSGVTRTNGDPSALGDWDTGFALLPDGAYLNMGDIGDQQYVDDVNNNYSNDTGKPRYPYVEKEDHFNSGNGAGTYFSPNRQVPSSMVLGSIPTGVKRFLPWQTLLFNPKPEDPNHPGRWAVGKTPPDHLIADLFWMPVVQPYPISQPFSTAGKINLNYQIQPFNYIERSTGIYALMKATKMMAIPASIYGGTDPKPFLGSLDELNRYSGPPGTYRFPINVKETLKGFEKTFNSHDLFRSASQISEINLVPQAAGATYDGMASFWQANTLTGDNLREKPYVDLYPRLTTKSNSYTVHFRVQVLQKSINTKPDQWIEGKDQVSSEYRGSSEIERYLDSSSTQLPDFAVKLAGNPADPALNLDNYYRYRIVGTKRFSPY